MDTFGAARTLEGLTPSERVRVRILIDEVAERDRLIARAEGEKATFLAELATIAHHEGARSDAPNGIEGARRGMAAEVSAATHTHPTAAKHQLDDAEQFVGSYPAMHEALCDGRISVRHARAVVEAGGPLTPDARASLDHAAVPFAEASTPGDLKRIVKKQAAEIAPLSLRERHQRERERRFVTLTERDDGMSDLIIYLPTFEGRALYDRATEMAKAVKADRRRVRREFERASGPPPGASRPGTSDSRPGTRESYPGTNASGHDAGDAEQDRDRLGGGLNGIDGHANNSSGIIDDAVGSVAATDMRTTDQLRVDILTDLLLTGEPTGHDLHSSGTGAALADVQATVQVTIPVDQIIDPDDGTSWIDEGGLVSPDTARGIAGTATGWERLFYRPETGIIEYADHYRPSAAQRRALIGRDMTCRFPGCTVPARKSDIDHSRDYARGGATVQSNLAALCEGHHMMKHQSGWTLRQGAHGVIEWTSPTGRTYRDEPASRVFFQDMSAPRPDDPAPPWAAHAAAQAPPRAGSHDGVGELIDDLERTRSRRERAARERQFERDRDARNDAAARARAVERSDDEATPEEERER